MADSDLSGLLEAVGLANKNLVANNSKAKEIVAGIATDSKVAEDAVDKGGKADAIMIQAQGLATKKAESQTQDFASHLGTNADSSTYIMNDLADRWRSATVDADNRTKNIQDGLDIKFSEHPWAYIKNHAMFEQNVKEAELADKRAKNLGSQLSAAQGATQQQAATNNALKSTVTDATLEASLDKATAALEGEKARLRMQNGGIQMSSLEALGRMDVQQINNLSVGLSAKNQAASLAIAQKHLKLAEDNAAMVKQEFEQKVKDKTATQDDIRGIADTVRAGASAAGFKNVSAMSDSKIIQMLNMKADGFQEFLKSGMKTQSIGTPIISENAGEAAKLVAETGAPLRAEQGTVKTFLNKTWQYAASPEGARTGQYDHTKKDQVTAAAGKVAIMEATKMQNNIDPLDGSNIYAAPPLQAVSALDGLKKTPFFQKVMADHLKSGELKEFKTDQLAGFAADAVRKKQITLNEAVEGLQAMHSGAARINNATKNYVGLGLPVQNSFKVQLPNALGFNKSYDMTTAQDVTRLLSSKLAAPEIYPSNAATNPFPN